MASAKLEIVVSAKDAASPVLGRVEAAFRERMARISAMRDAFLKQGEKIERFTQLISLTRMATETEGFKTALDAVSPSLAKHIEQLTSYGLAAGLAAQAAKSLASLSTLPMAAPIGGLAAVGAGTAVLATMHQDADAAKRGATERTSALAVSAYQAARSARTVEQFDAAMSALADAVKLNSGQAQGLLFELAGNRTRIVAANLAWDKQTAAINAQAALVRQQTARMEEDRAAREAARKLIQDRFNATPAGQMQQFKAVTAELQMLQGETFNPETQPRQFLEQQRRIEELTEELRKLNEGPVGKMQNALNAAGGFISGLFKPRTPSEAPAITRRMATLSPGDIMSDALSRQGLFAGGGRGNTLTGLRHFEVIERNTTEANNIWREMFTWMRNNLGTMAP